MIPFEEFDKIARLSRDCVITEKIDGTNAQIYIPTQEDILLLGTAEGDEPKQLPEILFGSRKRWITPEDDNFGFARWGTEHAEELIAGLGEGRHYGEWWGPGIQRRYSVKEKTFSLFNTKRWGNEEDRPACCSVVPVLYEGLFTEWAVNDVLVKLKDEGSLASPGFMRPEGIVIWHTASRRRE
jgi:hypothetical protein